MDNKQIFLNNIPKKGKKAFDWEKSINQYIHFIYDEIEGDIEIIKFIKDSSELIIKYKNNEFKIKTYAFIHCNIKKIIGKGERTKQFKIEIGTIIKDEKRHLVIIDREYRENQGVDKQNRKCIRSEKWCKYKCNIDDHCGWIRESHLLNGQGCANCANKVGNIHHSSKTNNKNEIYTDGISYPEKFMSNLLKQLKINFKTQLTKTTFKWIQNKRYDFYFELNNEQYIVETHGGQHYQDAWDRLENTQLNDKLKKELAIKNGFREENYIVIDCRYSELDWIKEHILESSLSELFDLSNINWDKCHEYALSNLVRIACEYKRINPNLSTTQIGEIMGFTYNTLAKWLNQGSEIGWCEYNAKEEKIKGQINSVKAKKKSIKVFKDGVFKGIFESVRDLERKSEKIFGVRIWQTTISAICLEKVKQYKGFTFSYVP